MSFGAISKYNAGKYHFRLLVTAESFIGVTQHLKQLYSWIIDELWTKNRTIGISYPDQGVLPYHLYFNRAINNTLRGVIPTLLFYDGITPSSE